MAGVALMLRYVAVSAASKAFSLTPGTRAAYRRLGNAVLDRSRTASGIAAPYLDRAVGLVECCDAAGLRAGAEVLELGTGWLHWESIVLRLFFDVRATLYDVVDNRLLGACTAWLGELAERIDTVFAHLPAERRAAARELARRAAAVASFEQLYGLLGFDYHLDPGGALERLPRGRFDLAVSADVLEHVPERALPSFLAALRECLVPGGLSVHRIDLVDHFHYFDTRVSPKHYYRYSDRAWRRWFESDVQYFNRVQAPAWRQLFRDAGFVEEAETALSQPIPALPLAPRYRGLTPADRECMQLLTVHRAPPA